MPDRSWDPWVLMEKSACDQRPETLAGPEVRSAILVHLQKTRGWSRQREWHPCKEEFGSTLPLRGFGVSTLNLPARIHDQKP